MKQKSVLVKSYFTKTPTDKREQIWQASPNTGDWEYSNCKIDTEKLAHDLQAAITALNLQGFKVVQVLPITSGDYHFSDHVSDPHLLGSGVTTEGGYGYGFSYTDSLIILAESTAAECPSADVQDPITSTDDVIIVD